MNYTMLFERDDVHKLLCKKLIDSAKPQYIDLSEFKDDEIIRITIKSVYNGSKYNDTCVSGIMLVKF